MEVAVDEGSNSSHGTLGKLGSLSNKIAVMATSLKHLKNKAVETSDQDSICMNHPANSNRMIKNGWLKKQGGMVKTWHKRWFVLNGECLFYFAKEDDLRPLGTIYLPGNKVIQHSVATDDLEKFLLEIVPGKVQPKMAPNHDTFLLCALNEDERQDWMKAIRRVMFSSVGGAIFGQRLEETMEYERYHSTRKVPYIIEHCISFLEEYGMEIEGIFRLPGRALLVRDLRDRFDMGEKMVFDILEVDVHSVASLLKQYLRELPECLIPYSQYQGFMNIAMKFQDTKNSDVKSEKIDELRNAMADLPVVNYNVLKHLCKFLFNVSEKTSINKMTAINLATVFGPNIIRHPQMDDNPSLFMLTTADISQQLAFMCINHCDQVFTFDFDSDGKAPVAVDDLLSLEGDDQQSSNVQILKPITPSAVDELSGIVMGRGDRRAISIPNNTDLCLSLPDSLPSPTDEPQNDTPSPRSDTSTPTKEFKHYYDEDGKPIAPMRRKQRRTKGSGSSSPDLKKDGSVKGRQPREQENGELTYAQSEAAKESEATIVDLKLQLEDSQRLMVALRNKNEKLVIAKGKSEERVKSLAAEREKVQTRYEEHIKTLEEKHKTRTNELCAKLDEEKSSRAEAVKKIVELQTLVQKYQMRYGNLENT